MNSRTEQKTSYSIALLLSTENRKTFEAFAREIQKSGDTIERMLDRTAATVDDLIAIVKKLLKRKRLYLVIDDTLILKMYSKIIPGTSDNYDSSDQKTYRSLCSIVAMITDGTVSLLNIETAIKSLKQYNFEELKSRFDRSAQIFGVN